MVADAWMVRVNALQVILVQTVQHTTHVITCSGRGACNNGTCACDPGYYGPNCEYRQACYFDNTGELTFQNKSTTGKTYNVFIDGAQGPNIKPGETSGVITVKAGQHTLLFKDAKTGNASCSQTIIQVEKCKSTNWWCAG
jgi:hypothetical protein